MTKAQIQLAREIEAEYGLACVLVRRAERLMESAVVAVHHPRLRGEMVDLADEIGRLHDRVLRDARQSCSNETAAPAGSRRGCRTTGER